MKAGFISFRLNFPLEFEYLLSHLLYADARISLINCEISREWQSIQLQGSVDEGHDVLYFRINHFANGEDKVPKDFRLDLYSQVLLFILEGFDNF